MCSSKSMNIITLPIPFSIIYAFTRLMYELKRIGSGFGTLPLRGSTNARATQQGKFMPSTGSIMYAPLWAFSDNGGKLTESTKYTFLVLLACLGLSKRIRNSALPTFSQKIETQNCYCSKWTHHDNSCWITVLVHALSTDSHQPMAPIVRGPRRPCESGPLCR